MPNNQQIEIINKLRKDYQETAALIPLKSSFYKKDEEPSNHDTFVYSLTLFLAVCVLAGLLTGFGAAAPIIGAIVSLFNAPSLHIGLLALSVFSLYAIPWALVYMPTVGNKIRSWWEGARYKGMVREHTLALEKAHEVLGMLFRKEIRLLEKGKINKTTLNSSSSIDRLANILLMDQNKNVRVLGAELRARKIDMLERFEIIQSKEENHLPEEIFSFNDDVNELKSQYDDAFNDYLNLEESTDLGYQRTNNKKRLKDIWQKLRLKDSNKRFYIRIANNIGSALGWMNATVANSTGTAIAPLFILSAVFMIFSPTATLPFYLSLFLVSLFALAGFVAAYGLTKESIESCLNKAVDFFVDTKRASYKKTKFELKYKGRILEKPWSYFKDIVKHYSLLPLTMSLFLAIAIASFNFLAGVTVGHLILNPLMLSNPIAVASFGITSLVGLHVIELFFGTVGFVFTVIAVTPLMVNAWQNFIKSLTLEPLSQNKAITFTALISTTINTFLLGRNLLRPGSPMDLFFGAAYPVLLKGIAIIAIISIFLLGFSLFYMGLKKMFADRGHGFSSIMRQNYHLTPNYDLDRMNLSDDFKRDIKINLEPINKNSETISKDGEYDKPQTR